MTKKVIPFDLRIKSSEVTSYSFGPKAKVYTNDLNAVELHFKVADTSDAEMSGSTASVLLFMRDGSFFQNTDVTRVGNLFTYAMKPNQIKHRGIAQVQLVIKKGTIENASPLLEFEIVGGLETKPITEVMIQDWTSLTAEAKAFVDQIEGFTLDQFVENKMGEELANLEVNYATRLTGLESADQNLTAQLAQTLPQNKIAQGYNKNTEPTVVFTFDDGSIEDLTVFKPILDQYGYKATTYIIGNRIGTANNLSIDDLKTLQNSGWEIGAHSVTHQAMGTGSMSAKVVEYEFSETKKLLNQSGFDARNFAYPFGSVSMMTNEIGVKYYDSLAMFGTGLNKINKVPIRPTYLNRVALGAFFDAVSSTYPITNTFNDYYKKKVDELIAEGGLLVFALHSLPHSQDSAQIGYLEDTLEYINSKGLNVVTLEKALESFGNSIDIEKVESNGFNLGTYLKVSNGEIYTNMFHPTVLGKESITNDSKGSDLPYEKRTIYNVTAAQGFPFTGVLINENNTKWLDFARQTLISRGTASTRIATRTAQVNGVFTQWREYAEKRPSKLWESVNITIPAKASVVHTVLSFATRTGDGIVVNTDRSLPFGISFYGRVSSDKAHIQFQNLTDADIQVTAGFNVYLISDR